MLYANANHAGDRSLIELLLHSIQLGANEPTPGAYRHVQMLLTNALDLANGRMDVTSTTDSDAVRLALVLRGNPNVALRLQSLNNNPLTSSEATEVLAVFQGGQNGPARLFAVT